MSECRDICSSSACPCGGLTREDAAEILNNYICIEQSLLRVAEKTDAYKDKGATAYHQRNIEALRMGIKALEVTG